MLDSETVHAGVPVALSTAQTEDTFTLAKYESTVTDRSSYLGPDSNENLREAIARYYDIEHIAEYFTHNKSFRNITLQFPDKLIQDSSTVTQLLQDKLVIQDKDTKSAKRNIWVLADTAYSPCCVDEVASEHVNADIVIHFGDACLNAIKSQPVLYCFGRPYLDFDELSQGFKKTYSDEMAKVCLMADAPHSECIGKLYEILRNDGYENLLYAVVDEKSSSSNCTILQSDQHQASHSNKLISLQNRAIYSSNKELKTIDEANLQENYDLFHITVPADPHLLFLTTKFKTVSLYDTETSSVKQWPYPSLMKRYKFMHVARTAGCIGILVNTLSLKNTKETINTLVKHIRDSGKKHYLFVVGKPNVAKLANFEPVDIWCILGCGQGGIILDQHNEFYKPIITPYELTLALKPEVTWTGQWVVDFDAVLDEIEQENTQMNVAFEDSTNLSKAEAKDLSGDLQNEGAPDFDAVTGKYISTSRPLRKLKHLELDYPAMGSRELTKNVAGGVIIKGTVSTSAAHLQSREWTGLGSDYSSQDGYDESGAAVEEGISGVASGYEFDRTNKPKSR